MTRPNGVEQSYSFGELASHNTAMWKAAVGPGSFLARVPAAVLGNPSTGQDQRDLPG
jgi:hypothetical protein